MREKSLRGFCVVFAWFSVVLCGFTGSFDGSFGSEDGLWVVLFSVLQILCFTHRYTFSSAEAGMNMNMHSAMYKISR